jgi:hypothetical protein
MIFSLPSLVLIYSSAAGQRCMAISVGETITHFTPS